jgi:thiamine biosynthesis lipoprotein
MIEILRRYGIAIAFFSVLLMLLFFTSEEDEIQQLAGYTMGTTFQLQFVGMPENFGRTKIQNDISALLDRLDRQVFSTYAEQSELSRFNRSPIGQPIRVSRELLEVSMLAREISELTNGAFDVTVGPLVNLWGFGPDVNRDQVPSAEQIKQARQRVGYQHLAINPEQSSLRRDTAIYVDLSGIAKGYVVDQVAAYFDSIGVGSYFLEIGGELRIKGLKPGGQSWIPALERPVDTAPQIFAMLDSRGEELALAGSGDYRNYFEQDGVRYSHEIDPRSGESIRHNLAAVYVINRSTARADALATALLVMGLEAGMELARDSGLAAYFIVRSGDEFESRHTEQFARYIQTDGRGS